MTITTSIYLPADLNIKRATIVPPDSYLFVSLENDVALLESTPPLGHWLTFDNGLRGVAIGHRRVRLVNQHEVDSIPTYAILQEYIRPHQVSYKDLTPNISKGELEVQAIIQNSNLHVNGYLGWSLFRNKTLLAVGNDLNAMGLCVYSGTAEWPLGKYVIQLTQFDSNLIPMRFGIGRWTLLSPAPRLSIGTSGDAIPPIELQRKTV